MAVKQLHQILNHLHNTFCNGTAPTDTELLRSFLSEHDQSAFAALVQRHGPMVLGVCRRVLGNVHDAEEAFQATFLLLARKAASIVHRERVGTWLYTVAYRAALEARALRGKRQSQEIQVNTMPEPMILSEESHSDLHELLDEELHLLPAKYREAILLCDLQGVSRKEAAQHLHIKEGTLSSRLATGRRKLAQRLARRGVTLSSSTLGALLESNAVPAVSSALVTSTVETVCIYAAGQGGAVSAGVFGDFRWSDEINAGEKPQTSCVWAFTHQSMFVGYGFTGSRLTELPFGHRTGPLRKVCPSRQVNPKRLCRRKRERDRFGDPLPAGAIARLGTIRFPATALLFFPSHSRPTARNWLRRL